MRYAIHYDCSRDVRQSYFEAWYDRLGVSPIQVHSLFTGLTGQSGTAVDMLHQYLLPTRPFIRQSAAGNAMT